MPGRLGGLVLLFVLSTAGSQADEARWRPWIEQREIEVAAPRFPDAAELVALRSDKAWVARWAAQTPSVAWNDVVAELVVKYQQNPLRAARAYTYVHTAIHDALVACARSGCEPAVRPVAMHTTASRMLDHLYTGEARGRLEALGYSAAAAVLAASGGSHRTSRRQSPASSNEDASRSARFPTASVARTPRVRHRQEGPRSRRQDALPLSKSTQRALVFASLTESRCGTRPAARARWRGPRRPAG